MPMRTKARQPNTRRTNTALSERPGTTRRRLAGRPLVSRKLPVVIEAKPIPAAPNGVNGYTKALRFLATLSDYERLRIVRYNSTNFDLDRMRTLLKRLGNPHEQFKSV